MLIKDRIKNSRLSPAEQGIADFLIEEAERVGQLKAIDVAQATYTSSPAVVRFCHKMGFSGWNEFRDAFYKEAVYLNRHFQDVDPNIPFHKGDSMMEIAGRIATLYTESVEDTMELLDRKELEKAVDILSNARRIAVFAVSNVIYFASEFVYYLEKIDKLVLSPSLNGDVYYNAMRLEKEDAAIILSYSGETSQLRGIVEILHEQNIPYIAITSIGGNSVSDYASAVLNITTREKSYSKIAGYTSAMSFHLILDILYSCLFARDYSKNLDYKISRSRFEKDRGNTRNAILRENTSLSVSEVVRNMNSRKIKK